MPFNLGEYFGEMDNGQGEVQPVLGDQEPYDVFAVSGLNPMGFRPAPGATITEVKCKNGGWDVVNGIVAPCRTKGGEAVPRETRKYTTPSPTPPCPPTVTQGRCNYKLI